MPSVLNWSSVNNDTQGNKKQNNDDNKRAEFQAKQPLI